VLHRLNDLLLVAFRQEEYFEGCGKASDLDFAVEAALVTDDTVHNSRDVVELVLDLVE
jgi:hypothetical protein